MQIAQLVVLVLACIGAAAALPFLLLAVFRRVEAGLSLLVLLLVLEMCLRESFAINLGISLYPEDVVYLMLAFVAALRMSFAPAQGRVSRVWIAFGVVLAASFTLGLGRYGTAAGVQFRGYFYAWSAGLYAMTFRYDERLLRRCLGGIVLAGCWVEFAAMLQWFSQATGVAILAPNLDAESESLRVVGAHEALLLADAVLLTLCFARLGGLLKRLAPLNIVLIPSLLLLQHRSAWLAAMAAVSLALALRRGENVRLSVTQAIFGAVAGAVMVIAILISGRGAETLASAVGESARRGVMLEDTAAWRLNGWKQLMERWSQGGPAVLAIGFPFGSDMTRYAKAGNATIRVTVAAHNAYVQTLYNTGILGLGLFLAFAARLAWSLLKLARDEARRDSAHALLAVLACQLVFYVPYGIAPLQLFLMGLGYAYVRSHRTEPGAIPAAGTEARGYA